MQVQWCSHVNRQQPLFLVKWDVFQEGMALDRNISTPPSDIQRIVYSSFQMGQQKYERSGFIIGSELHFFLIQD